MKTTGEATMQSIMDDSILEGLDPFHIPQDVVSDEEMLAVWGPKSSSNGFNYNLKEDWMKDIEDKHAVVYGSNKITDNTICEDFARCFLASKKGHSINWEKLSGISVNGCSKSPMPTSKRPFKGYVPPLKKVDGCSSHERRRTRSRILTRRKKYMSATKERKRKRDESVITACNNDIKPCVGQIDGVIKEPYVGQIDGVIKELSSRIEIQLQIKVRFEESLDKAKDLVNSYSSLHHDASDKIKNCRSRIEELKAEIREEGSKFAINVGEICTLWQSGEEERRLNELLSKEKSKADCVKKTNDEIEACQKVLQDNTLLEQICNKKINEKSLDLKKIEEEIAAINAVISELQRVLEVQLKYKQHLERIEVHSKPKRTQFSFCPLPVSQPIVDKSTDVLTVINVSPCPACNLGFDAQTLDIIVASCGHTFHPFCLLSAGNGSVVRKCPQCICSMSEMWLKSFGVVDDTEENVNHDVRSIEEEERLA